MRRGVTTLCGAALTAAAVAGTLPGIEAARRDVPAAVTGFKSVPGYRCPCDLNRTVYLPRGLVHTIVLQGTLLRGATAVTPGAGITGAILSASSDELTITLSLRSDMTLTSRRVLVHAGTDVLGGFVVQPVSLGRIDSITPAEIPGDARTIVTVRGADLASGAFDTAADATKTIVDRNASRILVALTPPPKTTSLSFRLGERLPSGDFRSWRAVDITVKPPVTGCRAYPADEVRPRLLGPSDAFVFRSSTGEPLDRWGVTFKWQPAALEGADPKHQLEVRSSLVSGAVTREVTGQSFTLVLLRGKYEWRVRSMNCGQPGLPSDARKFEIR